MVNFPKLTAHQLEECARRAEACIVHPYNSDHRLDAEEDYLRVVEEFRTYCSPSAVISMVQTINDPQTQKEFDLGNTLTVE